MISSAVKPANIFWSDGEPPKQRKVRENFPCFFLSTGLTVYAPMSEGHRPTSGHVEKATSQRWLQFHTRYTPFTRWNKYRADIEQTSSRHPASIEQTSSRPDETPPPGSNV